MLYLMVHGLHYQRGTISLVIHVRTGRYLRVFVLSRNCGVVISMKTGL